jgi:pimeloyl-ACP methyl ester carboxylesterase
MSSQDAVIVIPGVMGSELIDRASGRVLWGAADPRWYLQAWTSGSSMEALHLTDDERSGRYGRIRPSRLLRFPAFAPSLRGLEPYTNLLGALRQAVSHREAVAEFAYDWRLPVAHNAQLLAAAIDQHLEAWRKHPASGGSEARLILVAHSMGGLLARHLSVIPGATEGIRATLTLGTPFYGAPEVAMLLSIGTGGPLPLPRARLRRLASTLPGVHDLLPTYRCVDTGDDTRCLSIDDIVAIGGDRDMAKASARWHLQVADAVPQGHVQVVGMHQTTVQALMLSHGIVSGHQYTCRPGDEGGMERVNLSGDGTVPRISAQLPHGPAMPLAQSHGAIAKTSEALLIAVDTLADRRTGPWLGGGTVGLDVDDVVAAGIRYMIGVTGVTHPRHASCQIFDVATGRRVASPAIHVEDGDFVAYAPGMGPGLYRIHASGAGASAVTQLVMVVDPEQEVDNRDR